MQEINRLEADLARDVRYVRLRELRRVAVLYESTSQHGHKSRQLTRHPSPQREQALLETKAYIGSLDGEIVPTRQILQHLTDKGIEVGGKSPLNNLSAIISASGLFQAHGKLGWTLLDGRPS